MKSHISVVSVGFSTAAATLQINRTRRLGDSPACPSAQADPWCGDDDDPFHQLSCTPYLYWPKRFNTENPNFCNDAVYDQLAGGGDRAQAWAYFDDDGHWQGGDYWVFHSCDGAGIQPDCFGDVKYSEHFAGVADDTSCQEWPINDNQRNHCKFKHPGTGTIYDTYEAGWWNYGRVDGDCANGLIKDSQLKSAASGYWYDGQRDVSQAICDLYNPYMEYDWTPDGFGGHQRSINFVQFPWVCTRSGDTENNYFSSPSQYENGIKCYADNEPGTYKGTNGWPPYVYIYFMLLYKESDGSSVLKGVQYWIDKESGSYINGPSEEKYFLKVCHPGDDCPY